jgi:hypothetical protein
MGFFGAAMTTSMGLFFVGCDGPEPVRHLDPHGVYAFESASEITNAFKPVISTCLFDRIKTPHTEYLFVTVTAPFGGARIFEVLCYEHTEPNIWRQRGMVYFTYSPLVRPEFVPHGDAIDLIREGDVLFTFGPAAAQERRGRQPGTSRANPPAGVDGGSPLLFASVAHRPAATQQGRSAIRVRDEASAEASAMPRVTASSRFVGSPPRARIAEPTGFSEPPDCVSGLFISLWTAVAEPAR